MNNSRILFVFLLLLLISLQAAPAIAADSPGDTANQLIQLINQLRTDHELNALNPHPILMKIAQQQADYNAFIGASSHLDAQGLRPFQRALLAGYPVAGDLNLGGFYSENILNVPGFSARQVIDAWLGDELHANTMLSEYRTDIGVGVAVSGDTIYYVIDTALYSRWPVTPPAIQVNDPTAVAALLSPVVKQTPGPDGLIHHQVNTGETLWTISAAYGLTVEQLASQNQLDPQRYLQIGQALAIQPPATAQTADQPMTSNQEAAFSGASPSTPTPDQQAPRRPTVTPMPVSALLAQSASAVPTETASLKESVFSRPPSPKALLILAAALVLLAVILASGRSRNR